MTHSPASQPSATDPGALGTVGLDDLPLNRFHLRIAAGSAGGPLIDGYNLGIVGLALVQATPQLGLSATAQGLAAAASMLGIFLGAAVGGMLADRFGRRRLYQFDLLLLAAIVVATFWVDGALTLVVMRLLAGIVTGADIPLASAILAEFVPARHRGPLLGTMITMFFVGATCAYGVGQLLLHTGPDGWRWMLASTAVPALAFAAVRRGVPESPRWLVRHGRTEEARAVVQRTFGAHVAVPVPEPATDGGLRAAITGGYLGRLVFVAVFWSCSIIPLFALYAFGPRIFAEMGFNSRTDALASAMLQVILTIGCLVAFLVVDRLDRRPMLIISFGVSAVPLAVLGLAGDGPVAVSVAMLAVYGLAIGGSQVLQFVYPNELFPTAIRGTAVGIASGSSRIGAAIGTFAVPLRSSTWASAPRWSVPRWSPSSAW